MTAYGPCAHPAIQKGQDGRWYCAECGQPNCVRPPHFPPHCGCPAG